MSPNPKKIYSGVKWKHPLAKGLVGAWVWDPYTGLYRDLTGNNNGSLVGTSITEIVGEDGPALNFSSVGTSRIDLGLIDSDNPLSCSINNQITVVSKVTIPDAGASSAYPRIIDKMTTSSGFDWVFFAHNGYPALTVGSKAYATTQRSSKIIEYGVPTVIASSFSGTTLRHYTNGEFQNEVAYVATIPTTTGQTLIGNRKSDFARQWYGDNEFIFVFDIEKIPDEIARLSDDPYQILEDAYTLLKRSLRFDIAVTSINASGTSQAEPAIAAGMAGVLIEASAAVQSELSTSTGLAEILIAASGGVIAEPSMTVGTAQTIVNSAGTPQAELATASGIAALPGDGYAASGAPQAESATVIGTSEILIQTTGAVAAEPATTTGLADMLITASGSVVVEPAITTGIANTIAIALGAPQAEPATVSGVSGTIVNASGAVQAEPATAFGSDQTLIDIADLEIEWMKPIQAMVLTYDDSGIELK